MEEARPAYARATQVHCTEEWTAHAGKEALEEAAARALVAARKEESRLLLAARRLTPHRCLSTARRLVQPLHLRRTAWPHVRRRVSRRRACLGCVHTSHWEIVVCVVVRRRTAPLAGFAGFAPVG